MNTNVSQFAVDCYVSYFFFCLMRLDDDLLSECLVGRGRVNLFISPLIQNARNKEKASVWVFQSLYERERSSSYFFFTNTLRMLV